MSTIFPRTINLQPTTTLIKLNFVVLDKLSASPGRQKAPCFLPAFTALLSSLGKENIYQNKATNPITAKYSYADLKVLPVGF